MTFFLLMTVQALGAAWLLSQVKPDCEVRAKREAAAERFRKHWETKNWTAEMCGLYSELSK